jgi:hypothetical protein
MKDQADEVLSCNIYTCCKSKLLSAFLHDGFSRCQLLCAPHLYTKLNLKTPILVIIDEFTSQMKGSFLSHASSARVILVAPSVAVTQWYGRPRGIPVAQDTSVSTNVLLEPHHPYESSHPVSVPELQ